jgi:hypothetical protein
MHANPNLVLAFAFQQQPFFSSENDKPRAFACLVVVIVIVGGSNKSL